MPIKKQSGQEILNLLKQGYVRFKKEDDGNGLGSVEEVTGLSPTSLKEIFRHPRLVNFRVKVPLYIFVDDFEPETDEEVLVDDFDDETTAEAVPERTTAEIITAIAGNLAPVSIPAITAEETEAEVEAILAEIMDNAQVTEDAIFA